MVAKALVRYCKTIRVVVFHRPTYAQAGRGSDYANRCSIMELWDPTWERMLLLMTAVCISVRLGNI